MTYGEKLPWELIEEILSRLPPKSLVRFRAVSKQWNGLFEDKSFIRNHKNKMTPRFILTTQSKIYSVSINPNVEVRELVLQIPGLESQRLRYLVGHNDLLLCRMEKGSVIWNPLLKQTRWIGEANYSNNFEGIGYNDKSYMVLGYGPQKEDPTMIVWKIYDFASGAWKDHNLGSSNGNNGCSSQIFISGSVSLTGNLYWVGYDDTTGEGWCITQYYSSEGTFYDFCDLPCVTNHRFDAFVLAVFKGDRFSLLKQYHATKNIEVWVTKNKINGQSGGDVEWIKFMEVSSPDLPVLRHLRYSQPGYFIQDKTLVVCFTENGRAWIYFLGENKLIRKTEIHHVDGPWNLQYTYTPNLVQVPLVQKEETELTGGFSLYEFCYAYIHWWF